MARIVLFKHLAKRVPLGKNNGGEMRSEWSGLKRERKMVREESRKKRKEEREGYRSSHTISSLPISSRALINGQGPGPIYLTWMASSSKCNLCSSGNQHSWENYFSIFCCLSVYETMKLPSLNKLPITVTGPGHINK